MNIVFVSCLLLLLILITAALSFILVRLFVISDLLVEFIEDRKTDLYNLSDIEL